MSTARAAHDGVTVTAHDELSSKTPAGVMKHITRPIIFSGLMCSHAIMSMAQHGA